MQSGFGDSSAGFTLDISRLEIRKLQKGPADHELDFKLKVYANGRVSADSETLRALGNFSEREINNGTRLSRRIIRHIRHKGQVKRSAMQRILDFLSRTKTDPQGSRSARQEYLLVSECFDGSR